MTTVTRAVGDQGHPASSHAAPVVADDDGSAVVRQRSLPVPWRRLPAPELTRFVHPAERELARILTIHRVRWVYEPTTFVLERDEAGRPTLCFNPDFYLPDHGRYLELTTMRQPLVTRKNRKLRLLREIHPNIDVQLLYRRDFERLVERTDVERDPAQLFAGRTLFSAEAIDRRIGELADRCLDGEIPDVVLGLGPAAATFHSALTAAFAARGSRPDTEGLSLAGGGFGIDASRLRVQRAPRAALDRRRVLLVTDLVSTGLTTDFAARWLSARGAASVQVVTLLDRPLARVINPPVAMSAFDIQDTLVAGHGAAIGGRFGELPDIVEVLRTAP